MLAKAAPSDSEYVQILKDRSGRVYVLRQQKKSSMESEGKRVVYGIKWEKRYGETQSFSVELPTAQAAGAGPCLRQPPKQLRRE